MKYTKEALEKEVKKSKSILEVVRRFNNKNSSGSVWQHVKNRIKFFKINTKHFLGINVCKGKISPKKKHFTCIFNYKGKVRTYQLKRALIESGIEEICRLCKLRPLWNSKKLRLEVDHIDGNNKNNKKKNLRFLCPNCHSQTETYGYRGKNA